MKKVCLLSALMAFNSVAFSQDAIIKKLQSESLNSFRKTVTDTSSDAWKTGAVYSISLGQGTLSNWAAGGDDFSLSVASSLNVFACYKKNKSSWDNTVDISVGYVKTSSQDGRKNDDRFDLLSKYGYALSNRFNLATLVDIR